MSVYLDYNASSPIDPRVLDYMVEVYKNSYGNADSRTHDFGNSARKVVEAARDQVASILGMSKDEVFFTSGATESSNIVLQGLKEFSRKTGKNHIITSSIEHKAVLETVKHLQNEEGFEVDYVNPDSSGRINEKKVFDHIRDNTLIVSIMHVNNETGIIQPVKEIGEYLMDKDVFFHVDATQSFGKLVPEIRQIHYDMLSMSAHKISGPQGIGALVLRRKKYRLPPVKQIMFGGQQEHGLRPGTTPVALVAGLGKACEFAEKEYEIDMAKCKVIKNDILEALNKSGVCYQINGDNSISMQNTVNVSFTGVQSEALMLSSKQYCGVSNGSACTSNDYNLSYVLSAMGLDPDRISSSIRISWNGKVSRDDVLENVNNLIAVAKALAV